MVNQKFVILSLVTVGILVGCVSENIPTEKPATPTNTAVTPSLTSVPTETKTPLPTATIFLTPLPTLSRQHTFEQLFMSENICDAPCWWGIIPGVSSWPETKQFIEQFSTLSYGVHETGGVKHITSAQFSETYMWYVGNPIPNRDSSTTVYLEVQNNIVTAMEIGPELVWNFFPVFKLLETHGRPDEVLIGVSEYDIGPPMYYARIFLLYEDKHLLTSYGFSGSGPTNPQSICLHEYGEGYMYLWSPDTKLNFDFSQLNPLDDFSELSPEIFYERFKDRSNKCLEVSEDAWK